MTRSRAKLLRPAVIAAVLAVAALVALTVYASTRSAAPAADVAPALDPGTPLRGQAPDFTLRDQFGAPVSLHSFRGRVVILAFNDSQCTTVCPLTTSAMVAARRMLGAGGAKVALLGVDANPDAIAQRNVLSYSALHGMTRSWQFLTGPLPQLRAVWKAYHIDVAVEHDQIDHTPALFVIDARGRLAKLYLTQMAYASVEQQGKVLAEEASRLLPGHPAVHSDVSLAQIRPLAPTTSALLPGARGGRVALGPGTPRLLAFFATWTSEVTDLAGGLERLGAYARGAAGRRLPPLVAVDEASVEASPGALPSFLSRLARPLPYPVAVDTSGRVADGYGVQDQPWLVLVSADGRILWYYDVSTSGWLSPDQLARHVRAAMRSVRAPASPAAVRALLAGSPAPLAALHRQAGQILGGQAPLGSRLRALRGYPVVVNAWASWCVPCRTEFSLFASAAARYGRRVAFLGADTGDSPGDAQAFLSHHPVSYPSYQTTTSGLGSLAVIGGLPTTIFVDRAGKVAYVHTGQYDAQGTLDSDIESYLLSG